MIHDTRFCGKSGSGTNINMIADTDLSGQNDIVTCATAAGDANLAANQVVFPNLAVVG